MGRQNTRRRGAIVTNALYFGDNLHVLREHIADESVDLVYLDPPFNSNANYNILFKGPEGGQSESQIEAFEDTWHWNESAESAFDEVMRSGNTDAYTLLRAMREFLGDNDMMAYLAMMAVRLIELHRVLKPTGSLYLHCDPTASHYLKLLLDGVFGATNYRNEIVWKRTTTHSDSKTWSKVSDVILFYTKSKNFVWNTPRDAHSNDYVSNKYRYDDGDGRGLYRLDNMTSPNPRPKMMYDWHGFPFPPKGWRYQRDTMQKLHHEGRIHYPTRSDGSLDHSKRPQLKRYLNEMEGGVMGTVWSDIRPINSQAQERLGYPTQKPLALLERIIAASSNEGDVVLDPFCGCGTAVHAAQKLRRQWIGIDVTHLAIGLIEKRMTEAFPGLEFEVKGRPQSLKAAEDLARRDKHQFELWALSVVEADPWKGGRKGADTGIDGIVWFKPDGKKTEKAIVEVKGGGVGPKDIGRLAQVMERENAKIGVFLTARLPTRAMERDAAAVGMWENEYTGRKHARLQIITLAELFQNKRPDIPWVDTSLARKAKREDTTKQGKLL
ncbi:site-specific DNA-methyltransferase [Erythrobacter sp. 3-20A1M]|uniref:DNA methyltransferase n=1 Tax=Erythrobacter sp. 3-20A1M TaxID=2653850 RepID=UPI001BFC1754|nr:DNA methyltransferase [Erythrobacter sp. 3-20A1M]QWC57240.1 site-specific DNA-methyltransferase [Erythrobacter sp. 3-20A1M]